MGVNLTITDTETDAARRTWKFDGAQTVRLGRSPDNQVVFDGESHRPVSGRHAEIRIEDDRTVLADLGSVNGTFLDGRKITEARLASGASIQLGTGGPTLTVHIDGAAPAAPTLVMPREPTKKYGERTVGMLLQQALARAGLLKPAGTTKDTAYFEQLVDARVERTGLRLRHTVLIAAVATVLFGVGLGIYLYRNRSVQYIQQTQVNYGEAVGSAVAAANRYSVYLMAGVSNETGTYQGFCTAFAVRTDVLATNAHCIRQMATQFRNPIVLMNSMAARSYLIVGSVADPGFQDGRISRDVGLIRIQGTLPYAVTVATPEELAQIAPGMPVFLYGFPGRLNDVSAPEATFVTGEIGRLTGLDLRPRGAEENVLIQHSAFTSAGTSGSPLFNGAGHVIGINTGGYTENGKQLTGYNFGMRIDTIRDLLPEM